MKTAPYGNWKSPITSDLIVAETVGAGRRMAGGEVIGSRCGRRRAAGT